MIQLSLKKLKDHLHSKGIPSDIQQDTDQLCVVFKIAGRDLPLFFRIYEGGELLQLVAFLPCTTTPETLNDTARLLHLLNKETDTPGFGMDEDASVVFYRLMIPAKGKELDEQLLDAYLNALQLMAKSFAPVVAAVSYGKVTFEELMKQSKEQGGTLSNTQIQPE